MVACLHHFDEEQDPDPQQRENSDPDPHQSEKPDYNPPHSFMVFENSKETGQRGLEGPGGGAFLCHLSQRYRQGTGTTIVR